MSNLVSRVARAFNVCYFNEHYTEVSRRSKRWFYLRRAQAVKDGDVVTPMAHKCILKEHVKSGGMKFLPLSAWTYQVNARAQRTYYKDLEGRTCTCL